MPGCCWQKPSQARPKCSGSRSAGHALVDPIEGCQRDFLHNDAFPDMHVREIGRLWQNILD